MNTSTKSNYDLKIKTRIKLVHIAASALGLLDPKRHNTDPDDDYHRVLARWNRQGSRQPVTSSLQMNYQQLGELLEFFTGLGFKLKKQGSGVNRPSPTSPTRGEATSEARPSWKKYDSSIQGLRDEIADLAKARWGESWEMSLNSLCRRFGVRHWKWLDVAHGKEIKKTIQRMQSAERMSDSADDEVSF
jgi:hypothetical protein